MARTDQNQVPRTVSGGPKGGPKSKAGKAGRVSVAAARKSHGDRTQLIIGAVAIVVIVAVIVVGLVMYSKNSAVQGAGYGVSTKSVATIDADGDVTVSNGNPALSLDFYEDALCPICADLEHQYGEQIAKAVDDGQLKATYKMVDFLNPSSFSKNYSTRALAALITVAKVDGSKPGVWMQFHTALYDEKNQPKENGTSDLSNKQLADLAGTVGASAEAQKQIADGTDVAAATKDAQTHLNELTAAAEKVGRSAGTPTVTKDGVPLNTNDVDWLTELLPGGTASSGAAAPTSAN